MLPYAGRGLEALTALRLLGLEEPSPGAWQPAARPESAFALRAPSEEDPGPPLEGRLCGLTALRELALGASDLIGAAITADLCTLTHLTLLRRRYMLLMAHCHLLWEHCSSCTSACRAGLRLKARCAAALVLC